MLPSVTDRVRLVNSTVQILQLHNTYVRNVILSKSTVHMSLPNFWWKKTGEKSDPCSAKTFPIPSCRDPMQYKPGPLQSLPCLCLLPGWEGSAGGWVVPMNLSNLHSTTPWPKAPSQRCSLDCCLVHAWTFTAHSPSHKARQRPTAGKLLLAIEAFLNRWGCELCKCLPYKSVVWLGSKTKSHLKISSKFGHSIVVLVQRNGVNFIVISAWIKENYENKH